MTFLGFKLAEIKSIRTVHEVDRRQHQQRRLPSDMTVEEVHQSRRGCAHQVIRERPEITIFPYLRNWFIFRQADDGRHRRRIAREVRYRRRQQRQRPGRMENVNRNQLVGAISCRARNCDLRQIEDQLYQLHLPRRLPVKLRQRTGQSNQQGFRQAQFQNSQQGEQEVHR